MGFRSLTESIDTTSPGGKLILHIFGALAAFERELIVERTKAGLEAARRQGRVGGRPYALSPTDQSMARAMAKSGVSVTKIARHFGVSRATMYRLEKSANTA